MLHEDERKRKAKVKIVLEWLVVERGGVEHLLFATQFRCAQHRSTAVTRRRGGQLKD